MTGKVLVAGEEKPVHQDAAQVHGFVLVFIFIHQCAGDFRTIGVFRRFGGFGGFRFLPAQLFRDQLVLHMAQVPFFRLMGRLVLPGFRGDTHIPAILRAGLHRQGFPEELRVKGSAGSRVVPVVFRMIRIGDLQLETAVIEPQLMEPFMDADVFDPAPVHVSGIIADQADKGEPRIVHGVIRIARDAVVLHINAVHPAEDENGIIFKLCVMIGIDAVRRHAVPVLKVIFHFGDRFLQRHPCDLDVDQPAGIILGQRFKTLRCLFRNQEILFAHRVDDSGFGEFDGPGVVQGVHNTDKSITSFAKSCFNYALDTKQDLWFATKDTISKRYDAKFREVFDRIYENEYLERFKKAGICYFYTLIDDAVARVMKSEGGFIWACKNYDGDVMSDMLSSAFGSLAMMTSVLVNPDGKYEYEAAHGTVQRHYYRYLKGEETSTNSVATIFAWSGALRKRAQLDALKDLEQFADALERAVIRTIEEGEMTKDLVLLTSLNHVKALNSEEFILAIRKRLEEEWNGI